ncbi:hypothetical protein BH23BAC3_BH23BAC3_04180 [soil metagenome]
MRAGVMGGYLGLKGNMSWITRIKKAPSADVGIGCLCFEKLTPVITKMQKLSLKYVL